MAKLRQSIGETNDGFVGLAVRAPLVTAEMKLLEGSPAGARLVLPRDQLAAPEEQLIAVVPAGVLEQLREGGDAVPRRSHRRLEADVADGEAGLAADVGRDAAALAASAVAEGEDDERDDEADDVGPHG